MSDFNEENKPRERLQKVGAGALSDQELLAILLGSGTKEMNVLDLSNFILQRSGGLTGLRKLSGEEFRDIPGIGPARTASIIAAVELGRRFSKAIRNNEERTRISGPEDIYQYCHYEMENLDHEEVHILCLDTKHYLIAEDLVYKGTINTSSIRTAEIFRRPLMLNAASFVLVHNHPSGDPTPSAADIVTTRRIMETAKALELPLLDHVIIGAGSYTSIRSYLD